MRTRGIFYSLCGIPSREALQLGDDSLLGICFSGDGVGALAFWAIWNALVCSALDSKYAGFKIDWIENRVDSKLTGFEMDWIRNALGLEHVGFQIRESI